MTKSSNPLSAAQEQTYFTLYRLLESSDSNLTYLSLPDRSALINEIARVVPAGNVPSMVAAGLTKLPGRSVSPVETRRFLTLLNQGMQTFLDKAIYQTFFAGPAALLSAYQMLLRLTGKSIEESFPEGTWQFYVEFGLREDSGRHACETVGFQEALQREGIKLRPADELACWLSASAWLLDRYPALLANEWYEHVLLGQLEQTLDAPKLRGRWMQSRPYSAPSGADVDFTDYRKAAFEAFCAAALAEASEAQRQKFLDQWNTVEAAAAREEQVAAYLRQMTIHAGLQPGEYNDTRVPIPPAEVGIGVIFNGRYYLLRANNLIPIEYARSIGAAILRDTGGNVPPATLDGLLCRANRRDQPALRRLIAGPAATDLERLRTAPIIINWDAASSDQPLASIRNGRRGVGDHPLTIFRAANSTVFDVSHIFFDGFWGIAVAEILTGQALRMARLRAMGHTTAKTVPTIKPLHLEARSDLAEAARKTQLPPEVSAETTLVDVALIRQVRDMLRKRNDKLLLTVNDILLLHRALFNQLYHPSVELRRTIKAMIEDRTPQVSLTGRMALAALEEVQQGNPAMLIPIDASHISPRERVYPTTIRNPFPSLFQQHQQVLEALKAAEKSRASGKVDVYRTFEEARRDYLTTLNAFGQVLARHKDVSLQGGSVSTATIKLLAGLPASVQRMLDSLPGTFDVLNDVIKGQEVFSNVGQVSPFSSLRRFNTAKDDNDKKVLAWGVMTDAQNVMHISLRDSRPHVAALFDIRRQELAQQMAQEYVEAYARTLNQFMDELLRITRMRGTHGTGPLS